jgi:hypothetical protein
VSHSLPYLTVPWSRQHSKAFAPPLAGAADAQLLTPVGLATRWSNALAPTKNAHFGYQSDICWLSYPVNNAEQPVAFGVNSRSVNQWPPPTCRLREHMT